MCTNLRYIEAGFVDLCRLIYHGHDCIRNKILSLAPVREKGKQIKFFSSASSAVSRSRQSLKTLANNPSRAEVCADYCGNWQHIFNFGPSGLTPSANIPMETLVQRINKPSVQCLIIHESISLTSSVQSKRKETQEQAEKNLA